MYKMPLSRKRKAVDDLERSSIKAPRRVCALCQSAENDEAIFGNFYHHPTLSAHFNCMMFSSGLNQASDADEQVESHIGGFDPEDVLKEVRRAARLTCFQCRLKGASVGCVIKGCRRGFHFGCAIKSKATLQFFDNFSSYCAHHRPKQDLTKWLSAACIESRAPECVVCLEPIPVSQILDDDSECNAKAKAYRLCADDVLHGQCCTGSWLHLDCAKAYASSAGVYFCKCPLCSDKITFQHQLLQLGVSIPDKDANWELEPNAFEDLYYRCCDCTAPSCRCPRGKAYDADIGIWEILLCLYCGSAAVHRGCLSQLPKHTLLGAPMNVEKSRKKRLSWNGSYVCGDCSPAIATSPKSKQTKRRSSLVVKT